MTVQVLLKQFFAQSKSTPKYFPKQCDISSGACRPRESRQCCFSLRKISQLQSRLLGLCLNPPSATSKEPTEEVITHPTQSTEE
jgi:hypothetical protein